MIRHYHISVDQYDRMIAGGVFDAEAPERVELIQGVLQEMSPIGPKHEDVTDILVDWSFENRPSRDIRIRGQQSIELPGLASIPQPDVVWVHEKDTGHIARFRTMCSC